MKKAKTPARSRRRSTLRWSAAALVILLFLNLVLKTCFLFPIQSIRMQEENLGVPGRPDVISRLRLPRIHALHLLYLTGDDRSTTLSGTYLTPLGWQPAFGVALDCTTQEPIYTAEWHLSHRKHDARTIVWFGRIDDPAVHSLSLVPYERNNGHEERLAPMEVKEKKDFFEHDGRRYFVTMLTSDFNDTRSISRSELWAYDAQGTLLYEIPIEQLTGSFFS